MLWLRCLACFGLLVAVKSATIPVQVLYENGFYNRHLANVNRNLDAKIQLSHDELTQQSERKDAGVRNLEAKIQLSPEELNVVSKHLPVIEENEVLDEAKLKFATPPEDSTNKEEQDNLLLQKIEEILINGINNIKKRIQDADEGKSVKPEILEKLDKGAQEFLENVKNPAHKNSLKQAPPPTDFFQNLAQQFQSFTGNFVSQFTNQNQNPGQNEENQPGFPQNIVNIFTNGFQQIQSGFSQITGQQQSPANSTVLGDPVSTETPPPNNNNPFQGFINQAQGVFASFNPFNQGSTTQTPGTQGDPVSTTQSPNPIQSIQSAFSQFGQQIVQLNPFNPQSTQASGTQGDDPTTPSGPVQFVQGIQQVFNQFNPFNTQTTTKAPTQSQEDPPKNPLQVAAENVGNQFGNPAAGLQQVGQQIGTAVSGGNPLQSGSNPFQEAAQQVGSAVTSGNPFQSGSNPLQEVAQQVGSAVTSGNPFQSGSNPLQEVAQQVGSAVASGNPLQSGSNPLQEAAQQVQNAVASGNPLQSGSNPFQEVAQQVGSAIASGNPLQSGSNPLQEATQQVQSAVASGNPLQSGSNPLQQVAQQVGSAVAAGNALQSGSNPLQEAAQQVQNAVSPGSNPLQQVAQQFGDVVPSGTPLLSSTNPLPESVQQLQNANPLQSDSNPLQVENAVASGDPVNNPQQVTDAVNGQPLQDLVSQVNPSVKSAAKEESPCITPGEDGEKPVLELLTACD